MNVYTVKRIDRQLTKLDVITRQRLQKKLIFRLLPKDDEPVTEDDLAAIHEARAEVARGEISKL